MIRLIGLDMDGTTLTANKEMTPQTREAIQAALDHGIEVVFVTGRPLHGIPETFLEFDGMRYLITSNGAATIRLKDRCFVHGNWLGKEKAIIGLDRAIQEQVIYTLFYQGYGYMDERAYEKLMDTYRGTVLESYMKMSRRVSPDIYALAEKTELENFWIIADSEAQRDEIADYFRKTTDANVILQVKRDVEMVSKEADKGTQLLALGKHLGIRREEILAIGDNANDLGMIRKAGCGVAMGNASPAVKQAADCETTTNEENGVAKVIWEILNNEFLAFPSSR